MQTITVASRRRCFSVLSRLASNPDELELVSKIQAQSSLFEQPSSILYEPFFTVDCLQSTWKFASECGSPWWSVIAGTTLFFRLATLPLQASVLRLIRSRREGLDEFEPARVAMTESFMRRDIATAKEQLIEYNNALRSKGLLGIPFSNKLLIACNISWFLTFFNALRGMVTHPDSFPGFAMSSSCAWMPSLALADPLGILPVVSSIAYVAALESREEFRSHPKADKMRYAIRGLTFVMLPISTHLPAAFYVYMATNAFFNAGFALWANKYVK